jgi:hypothetical protein
MGVVAVLPMIAFFGFGVLNKVLLLCGSNRCAYCALSHIKALKRTCPVHASCKQHVFIEFIDCKAESYDRLLLSDLLSHSM